MLVAFRQRPGGGKWFAFPRFLLYRGIQLDLTPAFQTDYLSWDNVEPATLEVARRPVDNPSLTRQLRNPNQSYDLPITKWRALSRKELAASFGAYTGGDRICLVPRAILSQDIAEIKPGDVLRRTALDDSRWTTLDVQTNKFGQTFRLSMRNLVLAFDLRDKIDIERAHTVYDPAGAAIKQFPTGPGPRGGIMAYQGLAARVQLMTEQIADERGIRGFKGSYMVILEREVVVTNEDRIRLTQDSTDGLPAGTYLEIRDYHQAQTIDNLAVVAAERAV